VIYIYIYDHEGEPKTLKILTCTPNKITNILIAIRHSLAHLRTPNHLNNQPKRNIKGLKTTTPNITWTFLSGFHRLHGLLLFVCWFLLVKTLCFLFCSGILGIAGEDDPSPMEPTWHWSGFPLNPFFFSTYMHSDLGSASLRVLYFNKTAVLSLEDWGGLLPLWLYNHALFDQKVHQNPP
jgi:hypothetical protein